MGKGWEGNGNLKVQNSNALPTDSLYLSLGLRSTR